MPYMFLCYWSNHEGLSEHGTTIRCSWLTDKGRELLNDINWCLEMRYMYNFIIHVFLKLKIIITKIKIRI